MKKIKYFIVALCILSSCNERSNEDIFFSNLSNIIENETWLIDENDKAVAKVIKLIEDNPQSLDYQIRPLETEDINRENLVDIITSDDGNIRVYNVDNIVLDGNRTFGPEGRWIIQYRVDGTVYTDVWNDKCSSVIYIHSVQSSTKTYYLFVDYAEYLRQGVFMNETITAYSINPKTHTFQEEQLFKTTKENLSSININWEECRWIDETDLYSELHHIYCDDEELRVPLITSDGIMTEGYLLYLWNGEYFKYKGIEPIAEFKAEDWTIRIEILPDGKYRYSSWGKNKSTDKSPDLVLNNGEMQCWDEEGICCCNAAYDDGTSSVLGREYSFTNKGYLYRFEYGWFSGAKKVCFTISKGDEVILSTKAHLVS